MHQRLYEASGSARLRRIRRRKARLHVASSKLTLLPITCHDQGPQECRPTTEGLLPSLKNLVPSIGRLTFRMVFRPKMLPDGKAISSFKYWNSGEDGEPVAPDGIPRFITPSQQSILGFAALPFLSMPVTFVLIYLAPGSFPLNEFSLGTAVLALALIQVVMCFVFIPWANSCLGEIREQRYFEPEGSDPSA